MTKSTSILAPIALAILSFSSAVVAQQASLLARNGLTPRGAGPFTPPGSLYDNLVANGTTSLASQESSGTFQARSADDFRITATCTSGQFNISGIRAQLVQADAAPQPFAVELYADNGSGTTPSPASAITPIATFTQATQTPLGAFGAGTSLFEASFTPTAPVTLNANTTYWISAFGATAASNPSGFNNFFAVSDGAAATTDNGVVIAPGAGVTTWTPAEAVLGPPALAFSFAVDGTCASPVNFSITGATVTEGTGQTRNMQFVVTATPAPAAAATVQFATASGSATSGLDFTATSGTLNFGVGVTTQTIIVPILGDAIQEGTESFTVTLANPVGGALGTPATATGTITDDDFVTQLPVNGRQALAGLLVVLGGLGLWFLRRR